MQVFLLAMRDGKPMGPSDVRKIPLAELERLHPVYSGYYGGYVGMHQFGVYINSPDFDKFVLDSISPVMVAVILERFSLLQTITEVYPCVNLDACSEKGVPMSSMTRNSAFFPRQSEHYFPVAFDAFAPPNAAGIAPPPYAFAPPASPSFSFITSSASSSSSSSSQKLLDDFFSASKPVPYSPSCLTAIPLALPSASASSLSSSTSSSTSLAALFGTMSCSSSPQNSSVYSASVSSVTATTSAQSTPNSSPSPSNVKSWKLADVGSWLRDIGLGEYEEAFKDNVVDGELLCTLSEADLISEIGMHKSLHRRKFFLATKSLGLQLPA